VALFAGVIFGTGILNQTAFAASYDIAARGSITDFKMFDNAGNEYNALHAPIAFVYQVSGSYQISGQVNNLETLSSGDKITITLGSAPGSTYVPSSAVFSSDLTDTDGAKQFSVSAIGNIITLTKTAVSGSGTLVFQLQSTTGAAGHVASGIPSSSTVSTWYVRGFESLSVTIPNSLKSQAAQVGISSSHGTSNSIGNIRMIESIRLYDVYTDLLTLIDQGLNDSDISQWLLDKYGDLLTQDYIVVSNISSTTPNAIMNVTAAAASGGAPYGFAYDLRDDGMRLIPFYKDKNMQLTAASFLQGSLAPNLDYNQTVTAMTSLGAGKWASVKNSDGTWTYAANLGPLLGSDLLYYRDGTSVSDYPNTTALNARNQALIDTARSIGLAVEMIYNHFFVYFADESAAETATFTTQNTLFSGSSTVTGTTQIPSNQAEGQTAVKVRYVNILDNSPVAAVDNSYGWPAGNAAGEPTTAPVAVAAKDLTAATPQRYALVTDTALLAAFASSHNISSPQILTNSGTVPYPTTGTTEVYYVYAPVYDVVFEGNGGSATNDQEVVQTGDLTATDPAQPTRPHFAFEGWFIDEDFTTPYDFDTSVNADITLYAKWLEDAKCEYDDILYADDEKCIEPAGPDKPTNPSKPNETTPSAPSTGFISIMQNPLVIGAMGVIVAGVIWLRRRAARQ
jgi:uncharacterized repeat protein (TIGR02543 family)